MPYPANVGRFNITARLSEGEVMVHTLWMRQDAPSFTVSNLQGLTDRVRDRWSEVILGGTGLPAGLQTRLHTECTYTKVSGYAVDSLGKATDQAESLFAAGVKGTATGTMPPQCALVITLNTARPGRSGRGRLYAGALSSAQLAASGRILPSARDAFADALAGFYTRLRNDPNMIDAFRPVVVSPTRGESYKIDSIAVGDVIDTMRSRRNSLAEAKVSRVVDAG